MKREQKASEPPNNNGKEIDYGYTNNFTVSNNTWGTT